MFISRWFTFFLGSLLPLAWETIQLFSLGIDQLICLLAGATFHPLTFVDRPYLSLNSTLPTSPTRSLHATTPSLRNTYVFLSFKMNVNKKLDRFKQWTTERMGGEVKTNVSDDFKAMENETAQRQDGLLLQSADDRIILTNTGQVWRRCIESRAIMSNRYRNEQKENIKRNCSRLLSLGVP